MEGFVQIRLRPWIRRLVTRLIAIVPAVVVIMFTGQEGTYKLLIFSQVVLSLQLPFAIIPLIKFTSSNKIMGPGGMFKNSLVVNIFSWLSAGVIVFFNFFMLISNFLLPMFRGSWASITVAILIVIPLALALIALLLYLTFRKDSDTPMQYGNLQPANDQNTSLGDTTNTVELEPVTSAGATQSTF